MIQSVNNGINDIILIFNKGRFYIIKSLIKKVDGFLLIAKDKV